MAWGHLSINGPHLVYIILGGFTTLFMLCSSIIKERLYIGEATVATLIGVIFGPHAANLIDPYSWGNTDKITLEFARIVLVVQCFAVGVELPKAYMERHWRSVVFLLVPVMTFGWLVTSLFIWAVFHSTANWLDCLCIAACVTATDPVLASSVVGKGKFAKRVPKHLRDILSAESGCNDGMAFPFIYLALYIIQYRGDTHEVALEWFCVTILYECVFGAFYGFAIGYIARRLIRYSHEKDYIDRESFLVFYFVLALFCAGSGSLLGMDDLLIGFACGVGFSNDGWFTEKTEEAHVSNVIDLLLNLSFFVYFGTIIPWEQFDNDLLGLKAWKLVVIALLVLFFRRIPIMLALKPLIPDIKTWREALFAGHFGPIGVGAIFVSILARAELETGTTEPSRTLPDPSFPHYNVIVLVWPITAFLIMTSILIHGSSIAVFTLGKHINTLTLTLSYTHANEQGPTWMDRLPRIQSRSKSSMSAGRWDSDVDEKAFPPGMPPAAAKPGTFLRRQKVEDNPSRSSSRHRSRNGGSRDIRHGLGGPISQSAIAPQPRVQSPSPDEQPVSRSDSDTLAVKGESSSSDEKAEQGTQRGREATSPGEIYEEGDHTVFEDEEGNVLGVERESGEGEAREAEEREEGKRLMHKEHADENHGVAPTKDDPNEGTGERLLEQIRSADSEASRKLEKKVSRESKEEKEADEGNSAPSGATGWRPNLMRMASKRAGGFLKRDAVPKPKEPKVEKKNGPARAYQYGNTIVIEDEDGEVIKKYDIPAPARKQSTVGDQNVARHRIGQMGKLIGLKVHEGSVDAGASGSSSKPQQQAEAKGKGKTVVAHQDDDDDERVRFTLGAGGHRMSKADFIDTIQAMDPKRRAIAVENSNAPEPVKQEARKEAREQAALNLESSSAGDGTDTPVIPEDASSEHGDRKPIIRRADTADTSDLKLVQSNEEEVPFHNVSADLRSYHLRSADGETAAERRRRLALQRAAPEDDSDDDGTERVPPKPSSSSPSQQSRSINDTGETAAERRRREGALGLRKTAEESDSDDETRRRTTSPPRPNIRFADQPSAPSSSQGNTRPSTVRWGRDVRQ